MSFKHQKDVTPSTAMTDVMFQWQLTAIDVIVAPAFRTVTLLFHITQFFNIGLIGKVCLNTSQSLQDIKQN